MQARNAEPLRILARQITDHLVENIKALLLCHRIIEVTLSDMVDRRHKHGRTEVQMNDRA